jgi:hypothetical protein
MRLEDNNMLISYPGFVLPAEYTGIVYFTNERLNIYAPSYEFYVDRGLHRDDGPAAIYSYPADGELEEEHYYALYNDSVTIPAFELHYMLKYRKLYVENNANDYERLEEMRRFVS